MEEEEAEGDEHQHQHSTRSSSSTGREGHVRCRGEGESEEGEEGSAKEWLDGAVRQVCMALLQDRSRSRDSKRSRTIPWQTAILNQAQQFHRIASECEQEKTSPAPLRKEHAELLLGLLPHLQPAATMEGAEVTASILLILLRYVQRPQHERLHACLARLQPAIVLAGCKPFSYLHQLCRDVLSSSAIDPAVQRRLLSRCIRLRFLCSLTCLQQEQHHHQCERDVGRILALLLRLSTSQHKTLVFQVLTAINTAVITCNYTSLSRRLSALRYPFIFAQVMAKCATQDDYAQAFAAIETSVHEAEAEAMAVLRFCYTAFPTHSARAMFPNPALLAAFSTSPQQQQHQHHHRASTPVSFAHHPHTQRVFTTQGDTASVSSMAHHARTTLSTATLPAFPTPRSAAPPSPPPMPTSVLHHARGRKVWPDFLPLRLHAAAAATDTATTTSAATSSTMSSVHAASRASARGSSTAAPRVATTTASANATAEASPPQRGQQQQQQQHNEMVQERRLSQVKQGDLSHVMTQHAAFRFLTSMFHAAIFLEARQSYADRKERASPAFEFAANILRIFTRWCVDTALRVVATNIKALSKPVQQVVVLPLLLRVLEDAAASTVIAHTTAAALIEALMFSLHVCVKRNDTHMMGDVVRLHARILGAWSLWQHPTFHPQLGRYEAIVVETLLMQTALRDTAQMTAVPSIISTGPSTSRTHPSSHAFQPAAASLASTSTAMGNSSNSGSTNNATVPTAAQARLAAITSSSPAPASAPAPAWVCVPAQESGATCRVLLMLEPHLASDRAQEQTAFLSPRRLRSLLSVPDTDVLRLIVLRLSELEASHATAALTQALTLLLRDGRPLDELHAVSRCLALLTAIVQEHVLPAGKRGDGRDKGATGSSGRTAGSTTRAKRGHTETPRATAPEAVAPPRWLRQSGAVFAAVMQVLMLLSEERDGMGEGVSTRENDDDTVATVADLCIQLLRLSAHSTCALTLATSKDPWDGVRVVAESFGMLLTATVAQHTTQPPSTREEKQGPGKHPGEEGEPGKQGRKEQQHAPQQASEPQDTASKSNLSSLLPASFAADVLAATCQFAVSPQLTLPDGYTAQPSLMLRVQWLRTHAASICSQQSGVASRTDEAGVVLLLALLRATIPLITMPPTEASCQGLSCVLSSLCDVIPLLQACSMLNYIRVVGDTLCRELGALLSSKGHPCHARAVMLLRACARVTISPAALHATLRALDPRWPDPAIVDCLDEVAHNLTQEPQHYFAFTHGSKAEAVTDNNVWFACRDGHTLVAWVKADHRPHTKIPLPLLCVETQQQTRGTTARHRAWLSLGGDGCLVYTLTHNDNTTAQVVFTNSSISLHEWHHVAVSHHHSGAAALYVNGFRMETAGIQYVSVWAQLHLANTSKPHLQPPAARLSRVIVHGRPSAAEKTQRVPAGKPQPSSCITAAFQPLALRKSALCVGNAYVLTAPLTAAQAHTMYMQGPNRVSFGGAGSAASDILGGGGHMVATALSRLLRRHGIASLRALYEVLQRPPRLDCPFDASNGDVKALSRIVPHIACLAKPSEACFFFNQEGVLRRSSVDVTSQWQWLDNAPLPSPLPQPRAESVASHGQTKHKQTERRGYAGTSASEERRAGTHRTTPWPRQRTASRNMQWLLAQLRNIHAAVPAEQPTAATASGAALSSTADAISMFAVSADATAVSPTGGGAKTSSEIKATAVSTAPVTVSRTQLPDALVHIGGMQLLFFALGAAGPSEQTQSSFVRLILNTMQKNASLRQEFRSLRGFHLLADFLRSPRAVIGPAMLDALLGGALCLHAYDSRASTSNPRHVQNVEHCILVEPSLVKHCLLDFHIWKRAPVDTWSRAIALCTALISPVHCKFHSVNLLQLRSVRVVERCLLRWQQLEDVQWPAAVVLRVTAFLNHCLAGGEDALEGIKALMDYLAATHKIQRAQVRTRTVSLCGRFRRRRRRRLTSMPAAASESNGSSSQRLSSSASVPAFVPHQSGGGAGEFGRSGGTGARAGDAGGARMPTLREETDEPGLLGQAVQHPTSESVRGVVPGREGRRRPHSQSHSRSNSSGSSSNQASQQAPPSGSTRHPRAPRISLEEDVDTQHPQRRVLLDTRIEQMAAQHETSAVDAASDISSSLLSFDSSVTDGSGSGSGIQISLSTGGNHDDHGDYEGAIMAEGSDNEGEDEGTEEGEGLEGADNEEGQEVARQESSDVSAAHGLNISEPRRRRRSTGATSWTSTSTTGTAGNAAEALETPTTFEEWIEALGDDSTDCASPRLGFMAVLYHRVQALLHACDVTHKRQQRQQRQQHDDAHESPVANKNSPTKLLRPDYSHDKSTSAPSPQPQTATGTSPSKPPRPQPEPLLSASSAQFVRDSMNGILRPTLLLALTNSRCKATRLCALRLFALAVQHHLPSLRRHVRSSRAFVLLALQLSMHRLDSPFLHAAVNLFAGRTVPTRPVASSKTDLPAGAQQTVPAGLEVCELQEDLERTWTWVYHAMSLTIPVEQEFDPEPDAAAVVITALGACHSAEQVAAAKDMLLPVIQNRPELASALLEANACPVLCDLAARIRPVEPVHTLLCTTISEAVCSTLLSPRDTAAVGEAVTTLYTVTACMHATPSLSAAEQCSLHIAVVSRVLEDVCAPAFMPRTPWLSGLPEPVCNARVLGLTRAWEFALQALLFHFNHKPSTASSAAPSSAGSEHEGSSAAGCEDRPPHSSAFSISSSTSEGERAYTTFVLDMVTRLKLVLLRVISLELAGDPQPLLEVAGQVLTFLLFPLHATRIHAAATSLLQRLPQFVERLAACAPATCAQLAFGAHRLRRYCLSRVQGASDVGSDVTSPARVAWPSVHVSPLRPTRARDPRAPAQGQADAGEDTSLPSSHKEGNEGTLASSAGEPHSEASSGRIVAAATAAPDTVLNEEESEALREIVDAMADVWSHLVSLAPHKFDTFFDPSAVRDPHASSTAGWHDAAFAGKRVLCRLQGIAHEQANVQSLFMKTEHTRQAHAQERFSNLRQRAMNFQTDAIAMRDAASHRSILDLRRRLQRAAQVRAMWKRVESTSMAQPSPWFASPPRALWMLDAMEDPSRRRPKLTHCPWLPNATFHEDTFDSQFAGYESVVPSLQQEQEQLLSEHAWTADSDGSARRPQPTTHPAVPTGAAAVAAAEVTGGETVAGIGGGGGCNTRDDRDTLQPGAVTRIATSVVQVMRERAFFVDPCTLSPAVAISLVYSLLLQAHKQQQQSQRQPTHSTDEVSGRDALDDERNSRLASTHANGEQDTGAGGAGGSADDDNDEDDAGTDNDNKSRKDKDGAQSCDQGGGSAELCAAIQLLRDGNTVCAAAIVKHVRDLLKTTGKLPAAPQFHVWSQKRQTAPGSCNDGANHGNNTASERDCERGNADDSESASGASGASRASASSSLQSPLGYLLHQRGEKGEAGAGDSRALAEGDLLSDSVLCTLVSPFTTAAGELLLGRHHLYFKAADSGQDAAASPSTVAATAGNGAPPKGRGMFSLNLLGALSQDPALLPHWPLSELRDAQPRRYMLQHTALELFFTDGRTLLCDVHHQSKRDALLSKLVRVTALRAQGHAGGTAGNPNAEARGAPGAGAKRTSASDSLSQSTSFASKMRALFAPLNTSTGKSSPTNTSTASAVSNNNSDMGPGASVRRSRSAFFAPARDTTNSTSSTPTGLPPATAAGGAGAGASAGAAQLRRGSWQPPFQRAANRGRREGDAGNADAGSDNSGDGDDGAGEGLSVSTTEDAWTLGDVGSAPLRKTRSSQMFRAFSVMSAVMKGRPAVAAGTVQEMDAVHALMQHWQEGEITNFQYIMSLNTLAGRTFSDLSQYPVFPHVVADYYSSRLNLTDPETFRDLSKPMGALDERRLQQRLEYFEETKDMHRTAVEDGRASSRAPIEYPHMYGSHYSTAAGVMYYLTRLEPFAQLTQDLHGGRFDVAERLFESACDSWALSSGRSKSDVKELIPEFFYLPEFLLNVNGYHLGCKQDGAAVGDVTLPPWANSSPRVFVRKMAEALESEYVSQHLHLWVDLIFGFKQTGRAAEDSHNVFHPFSYEGPLDDSQHMCETDRNAMLSWIREFGQTPRQLFSRPHPARNSTAHHPVRFPLLSPLVLPHLRARIVQWPSEATHSHYPGHPAAGSGTRLPSIVYQNTSRAHDRGIAGRGGEHISLNSTAAPSTVTSGGDDTVAPEPAVVLGISGHAGGGANESGSYSQTANRNQGAHTDSSSSRASTLTFFGAPSAAKRRRHRGHREGIASSVCVDEQRNLSLHWNSWDDALLLVDTRKNVPVASLPHSVSSRMTCIDVCLNLRCAVVGYGNGVVRFVGYDTSCTPPQLWRVRDAYTHAAEVCSIVCNSRLSFAVTGSPDCTLQLWDLSKKQFVRSLVHNAPLVQCATSGTTGDIAAVTAPSRSADDAPGARDGGRSTPLQPRYHFQYPEQQQRRLQRRSHQQQQQQPWAHSVRGSASTASSGRVHSQHSQLGRVEEEEENATGRMADTWAVHLWSVNGQFVGEHCLPHGVEAMTVAMTSYPVGCPANAVLVGRSDGIVSVLNMLDLSHVYDISIQHAFPVTKLHVAQQALIVYYEDGHVLQWEHAPDSSSEA